MMLNDESLLSAYLDGELAPDQRSALEAVLLSDAELAKQLRGLAEVRGLVAGLPRPRLPVDLSPAVSAGIAERSLFRGPWPRLLQRRFVFTAAGLGGLGVAASLILGLLFVRPAAPRPAAPRPAVDALTAAPAPARTVEAGPVLRTEPPAWRTAAAPVPVPRARKREDAAAAEKVRALLESPRLRRVLIVTDIIGEGTLDRVEKLVQTTPRTDAGYGRITVSQGIVIDPLHPNEATVFALVMNDEELKHFQKKLEQSFPKRVEDGEADPVVVSQLGEVGSLAVLQGTPASSVVIPSTDSPRVALRSDRSLHQPAMETQVAAGFGRPDLATAAKAGAGAAPPQEPVSSNGADSPPAAGKLPDVHSVIDESLRRIHDPPEIVLVWVTKP
jgi:anti-sigma factor RsiW